MRIKLYIKLVDLIHLILNYLLKYVIYNYAVFIYSRYRYVI